MDVFEILLQKIEVFGLSELSKVVLFEIAKDKHGIASEHPAEIIMSVLNNNTKLDEINSAIIDLTAQKLLIKKNDVFLANYSKLGISNTIKADLISIKSTFKNLSQPHSSIAMQSLTKLFDTVDTTLYLSLEITSPKVFKHLEDRAKKGKKTVFLMPSKKHVASSRQKNHEEIYAQWKELILESKKYVRKNVEIRFTTIPFNELYTSAYSEDVARYDLFFLNSNTTRHGIIFEIEKNTSLHLLIFNRYKTAIYYSYPSFRLWPFKHLFELIQKKFIYVMLFFIALGSMALDNKVMQNLGSGVVLAILANFLTDLFKRTDNKL